MTRYGLYYAPPPESALWAFGCSVLGYDAATGEDVVQPVPDGFDAAIWQAMTASPRRYGFHGTLKAPFSLKDGITEDRFLEAAGAFADAAATVSMPPLRVATIGHFIAFVPAASSKALNGFAGSVVEEFEPFRAPLSEADKARRLASPLSDRQKEHLQRWGYPYVFEDFRFHMTLTGAIADTDARNRALAALQAGAAALATPQRATELAVFRQNDRDSRFRIIARFPFADG